MVELVRKLATLARAVWRPTPSRPLGCDQCCLIQVCPGPFKHAPACPLKNTLGAALDEVSWALYELHKTLHKVVFHGP